MSQSEILIGNYDNEINLINSVLYKRLHNFKYKLLKILDLIRWLINNTGKNFK